MHRIIILLCCFVGIFAGHIRAESKPTLTLAIDLYKPYFYLDQQGQGKGFYYEIFELLATRAGYKPKFVVCPFSRCMDLVAKGEADLVTGLLKTPERQQSLTYFDTHLDKAVNYYSFYQLKNRSRLANLEDLEGKLVGVVRGVTYYSAFDDNDEIMKVQVNYPDIYIQLLLKGRIDAFIYSHYGEERGLNLTSLDTQNKIVRAELEYKSTALSFFASSKMAEGKALAAELSPILAQLKQQGEVLKVAEKYDISKFFQE